MRLGNIEFIWGKVNKKYELVKWNETGVINYVIAFFDRGKEGFDMRTVGNRFFEDKNAWIVGKHAMAFLNEIFEIEEKEGF